MALIHLASPIDLLTLSQESTAQFIRVHKQIAASGALRLYSTWMLPGVPGAPATPATGTGESLSKSSVGSWQFDSAPSGQRWRVSVIRASEAIATGAIFVADRYVQCSGYSGNTTSDQTINTVALPARAPTDGVGVRMYVEWYAATGATLSDISLTYVNQDNNTVTSPVVRLFGTIPIYSIFEIPYAVGDTGVKSVVSLKFHTATGTAGNVGVTLAKPILASCGSVGRGQGGIAGYLEHGCPFVHDDACLFAMISSIVSTTATPEINLDLVSTLPESP